MLKTFILSVSVLAIANAAFAQDQQIQDAFEYRTASGQTDTIPGYKQSVPEEHDNGKIRSIYIYSKNLRQKLRSKQDCINTVVSFSYRAATPLQRNSVTKKNTRQPESLTLNVKQTCGSKHETYNVEWYITRQDDEYIANTKIRGIIQKNMTRPNQHDLLEYLHDQSHAIDVLLQLD